MNAARKPLDTRERAQLRSAAHALKPVLQVGRGGVNEASVAALREAFNTRKLLKIRVLPAAPNDIRDTAEALASKIDGSGGGADGG